MRTLYGHLVKNLSENNVVTITHLRQLYTMSWLLFSGGCWHNRQRWKPVIKRVGYCKLKLIHPENRKTSFSNKIGLLKVNNSRLQWLTTAYWTQKKCDFSFFFARLNSCVSACLFAYKKSLLCKKYLSLCKIFQYANWIDSALTAVPDSL